MSTFLCHKTNRQIIDKNTNLDLIIYQNLCKITKYLQTMQMILLLCILLGVTQSIANAGSLVSVPFPLKPPKINLNLPVQIPQIVANQLQLSSIYLKSLTYQWQFTESLITVNISDARIYFKWLYKADEGEGTFAESQYSLQLSYKFVQNNKNRLEMQIVSSKSQIGHSSVHLGGNVKQTVAVQVTNLIMNHAAVTFRKAIQNTIVSAVKSFSSILDTDIKIICSKDKEMIINSQSSSQSKEEETKINNLKLSGALSTPKCVYINTSLVAPPIVSNKTLLIQINGAPYLTGQQSGTLNPEQVLVKTNTSLIQLQVHEKLLQQTLKKVLQVLPEHLDIWVNQVSSTPDLNSLTFSSVFPMMAQFKTVRNVMLSIASPTLSLNVNQSNQQIQMKGKAVMNVFTKDQSMQNPQKYMNPCEATFGASLSIVYGWKSLSVRVKQLNIIELECDQEDVNQGLVQPDQFNQAAPTLSAFLKAGINGDLNAKVTVLSFKGIQALLSGKITGQVMRFDLSLSSTTQQVSQSSKVSLILQD